MKENSRQKKKLKNLRNKSKKKLHWRKRYSKKNKRRKEGKSKNWQKRKRRKLILERWLHNWKSINNLENKRKMIRSMLTIQPTCQLIAMKILKEIRWLKKFWLIKSMNNKIFNWILMFIILFKLNMYYLQNLKESKRKVAIIKRNFRISNSYNKQMKWMILSKSLFKICQDRAIKC